MNQIMRTKFKLTKNQKGMTLIELMAVVVILGILAAVAGAAVMKGFDSSKKNADATSVKVITDAVQRYIMDGGPASEVAAADKSTSEATALKNLKDKGYINEIPKVQEKNGYFKIVITGNIVTVTVEQTTAS